MTLVVFTHVHEHSNVPIWAASLFYSIDRCAVPIFFMISGFFIMEKSYNCNIIRFYADRIPRFLYSIVFCSTVTNFVYLVTEGTKIKTAFLEAILYENGITHGNYYQAIQLWFMYPLISVYTLSPFLSRAIVKKENIYVFIFIIISLSFNQVKSFISLIGYDVNFLNVFGNDFPGPYVCFFVVGYKLIGSMQKHEYTNLILSVTLLFTLTSTLLFYDIKAERLYGDLHWYSTSLQIFVCSICLYLILKFIFIRVRIKLIEDIGRKSFGIYLIHYALLYIFIFYMKNYGMPWYEKIIFYFIPTLISSYALVSALQRVKFFKRLLA